MLSEWKASIILYSEVFHYICSHHKLWAQTHGWCWYIDCLVIEREPCHSCLCLVDHSLCFTAPPTSTVQFCLKFSSNLLPVSLKALTIIKLFWHQYSVLRYGQLKNTYTLQDLVQGKKSENSGSGNQESQIISGPTSHLSIVYHAKVWNTQQAQAIRNINYLEITVTRW